MPALKWLPEAVSDLVRLHAFLSELSPEAGRQMAAVLLEGAEKLVAHRHMGRPHGDHHREGLVRFSTAHSVLRYRVNEAGDVAVIRVWHERENR